jgi:hypothetical protein
MLVKFTTVESTDDTGAGGTFREYYYSHRIPAKIISGSPSINRPVLYTPAQLSSFERITDIRNPAGEPLLTPVNLGFEIISVYPVINPYGFADGFAYGLLRLSGDALRYVFKAS